MNKPLTKEELGKVLSVLFPDVVFLRNHPVAGTGIRTRPDYHSAQMRLVVQFDDPAHYTKPERIIRDEHENRAFLQADYEVVRIPYFVQISTEVVVHLFRTSRPYPQSYPHGFVHRSAPLPAAFCCLGVKRFVEDLERFSFIKSDILQSLEQKALLLGDDRLVYPGGNKEQFCAALASRDFSLF